MPSALLTFIIPIRHPENAKDWGLVKQNLAETARSIAAQTDSRWSCIVVSNRGSDLPPLPPGFEIVHVDLPPNAKHDFFSAEMEIVYDAVRLDKGRRILSGLVAAKPSGHTMICDDDDLVSRRLVEFVSLHRDKPGWFIETGYVWSGGRILYRAEGFSGMCGTSHIIRSDLYEIPETEQEMNESKIKRNLGSHIFIASELSAAGYRIAPLPFPGAIYRVGHPGSHSQSRGLLKKYFYKRLFAHPIELTKRLSRLTVLTPRIRNEFFG